MNLLARLKTRTSVVVATLLACAFFVLGGVILMSDSYGLNFLRKAVDITPGNSETKKDYETLLALAESVLDTDGEVKTYLLLFQNNMELRPGGGFIGSFGILKIRDGELVDLQVHDVVNVDFRVPYNVEAPYPMETTIGVKEWGFRDSNFSPHYPENVKQAEFFYNKFGGEEKFDGVVAITTHVLESVLSVTGPVEVPGYPGTYDAETGVLSLEEQVEIDFVEQDIKRGDRKLFMKHLADVVVQKVKTLSLSDKYRLFQILLADMHAKDVQLAFQDERLQKIVEASGWGGKMNESWSKDYLMVVDANLNSFKSDHVIDRSYRYELDSTVNPAQAKLTITYDHTTAKEKTWLVKEYQTYLRVYLPKSAYITGVSDSVDEPRYGEFLGKKWVGTLQQVALGEKKSVTINYTLPAQLMEDYDLLIERQPGIKENTSVTIQHKKSTGIEEKTLLLDRNKILSELE